MRVLAGALFSASRRSPVHAGNVNDDWDRGPAPRPAPVPVG